MESDPGVGVWCDRRRLGGNVKFMHADIRETSGAWIDGWREEEQGEWV